MKWWAYIFSCYFLLLAVLPCQDSKEAALPAITIASIYSADTPTEQQHHSLDFCSPLCICFCCSVQVATPAFIALPPALPFTATNYQRVLNNSLPNIPHTIWQPPQLG
ncbi:hypothetical protein KTO58_10115 [Chitinophaga pendula]|uniref:DUF6660 family protein n=1 Tax=Chitinophaga TaxID=79328 RepID=UPI000BB0CADD|nr:MULTISPECIES: DUF6660 family protein [Chitinophaga]ASZ12855.1 hypothetical protein CK934_18780 [Chitinophaga sp. MD30]UCJ09518.1 hypothetical protein KTO58_10115 [Chitinophaga pendula]